jgi:hypothetical protein
MDALMDKATIGQIVLLVATLMGTIATIYKAGQNANMVLAKQAMDAQHQLDMLKLTHDNEVEDRREKAALDREERAALAARVDTAASTVRTRLDSAENAIAQQAATVRGDISTTAAGIAQRVEASAHEALDAQTVVITQKIDEAKTYTAQKADAAFHEANSVNKKIEMLGLAHEAQGRQIAELLGGLGYRAPRRNGESTDMAAVAKLQRTVEEMRTSLIAGQTALADAIEHERRNRKAGAVGIQAALDAMHGTKDKEPS